MIKFNKHYVTNGTIKAKVLYSAGVDLNNCRTVTLYAKDYSRNLGLIFTNYRNDTDTMTDYFDQGHVTFHENDEHYQAAFNRATFKKETVLDLGNNFNQALEQFLKDCQTVIDKYYLNHISNPYLSYTKGKKYLRIIKHDYKEDGGAVYGFVEINTGHVFRAKSYKGIKPGSMGCIYNDDHGASKAGEHSI